ncbi:hypothetical protein RCH18_003286 [Flavobacterium sp. PL11]|uniref:hypothetical protein n=1 Tax=Flavobacterium sp. PL11 TaxID=3071717 RepID=UPI002E02F391|nr:hypothetical protein [Flavobacterium sp. PL11]
MQVQLQLLEVELINFTIEKELYEKERELTSLVDHRPIISAGHSINQNFIEFTINVQICKNGKVCSITTFSRFVVFFENENFNMLENIKDENVADILANLGVIANAHLMGVFRIKSSETEFDEYIIPVRSHSEMHSMFADYNY